MFKGPIQLYDLSNDLGEAKDIASQHPDLVRQANTMMAEAHTSHPNWKPRGRAAKKQPAPGDGKRPF